MSFISLDQYEQSKENLLLYSIIHNIVEHCNEVEKLTLKFFMFWTFNFMMMIMIMKYFLLRNYISTELVQAIKFHRYKF